MQKCRIYTNSVSDLSPALAAEYNIGIVPDIILFKDKEYFNNIDIDPPRLFEMLREVPYLPTTSHPNQSIYAEAFSAAAEYDEILCINVTTRMSGSFNTATQTAQALREEGFPAQVYTYDSLNVSLGLGFLSIRAAELARNGAGARQIMEHLDTIRDKVGVYFCMPSLENAKKGGRIGEIKCFAADVLGIRPILTFRDGTVKDLNLTRGFNKAVERIFKYYADRAKRGGRVFVCHANNERDALKLKKRVEALDPDARVSIEWVGAVIGIYTGEGTIALIFEEC